VRLEISRANFTEIASATIWLAGYLHRTSRCELCAGNTDMVLVPNAPARNYHQFGTEHFAAYRGRSIIGRTKSRQLLSRTVFVAVLAVQAEQKSKFRTDRFEPKIITEADHSHTSLLLPEKIPTIRRHVHPSTIEEFLENDGRTLESRLFTSCGHPRMIHLS
jgi:hypothetical protein